MSYREHNIQPNRQTHKPSEEHRSENFGRNRPKGEKFGGNCQKIEQIKILVETAKKVIFSRK